MRGHHIDYNPASSQGIAPNLDGRIAKTSILGENRKSEVELKVGGIKTILEISRNRR